MSETSYTIIGPVTKKVTRPINSSPKNPKRRGSAGSQPDKASLISWWGMEAATANNEPDQHGTYTLSQFATPTSLAGKVANCRDFNGAGTGTEYFRTVDAGALAAFAPDMVNGWSMTFWVDLDTIQNCFNVAKATDTTTRDYGFYYENGVGWGFNMYNTSNALTKVRDTNVGTFTANTWYFCYGGYNAAQSRLEATVNAGNTFNTTAWSGTPETTGSQFTVGIHWGSAERTDGSIDEMNFWGRALTVNEVKWLYNSGAGRAYSALV